MTHDDDHVRVVRVEDAARVFARDFNRDSLAGINASAVFMSIVPDGDGDVLFWAQLGCAIMLGKPILVVAPEGRDIPKKLRSLADAVVEADIGTEAGRLAIMDSLEELGA